MPLHWGSSLITQDSVPEASALPAGASSRTDRELGGGGRGEGPGFLT